MTEEILILKKARKVAYEWNQYKHLKIIILGKIKQAKEGWRDRKCLEFKEFQRRHDFFNPNKRVHVDEQEILSSQHVHFGYTQNYRGKIGGIWMLYQYHV